MVRKNIVIVAYNDAQLLDITGPFQVFASANDEKSNVRYQITVASLDGPRTQTSSGLTLETVAFQDINPAGIDTLIIVGGRSPALSRISSDTGFRLWLRECAQTGRRITSVCTGVFALAAAGLVDGKRVATHWQGTELLAQLYPAVEVDGDAIYVQDGNVWTSAGVTTGIDMCLALVTEDCGPHVTMAIARRLVVYAHRPGNQSQFSPLLEGQAKADGPLAATLQWISDNLSEPISVADCAQHACMSARTFHRKFVSVTGITPARYIESLRLDIARTVLERKNAPLKQVAALSGFSNAQHLIQVFDKRLGLSPTDYRKLHGSFLATH